MNSKFFLSYLAIFTLFLFFVSCDKIYEPIEIKGKVIDLDTSQPISNAEINIVSPDDLKSLTFTNENGEYFFEDVSVDSIIDVTIHAFKEGYSFDSVTLLAVPEKILNVPNLRLRNLSDSDGNGTSPRGSASITLLSKSNDFIQVLGTGGNETVDLVFVVSDSSGVPIGNNNAVYVNFQIIAGPNGGESIYPDSVRTQSGIARATLTSGNSAGVLQVRASFTRNGITANSSPVPITISGGLPNDNHFEVSSEFKNIPSRANTPNTITALLGDKHGNPVIPGTAVYFGTNKGNIDGSANTNEQGLVTSQLRTNNTTPGLAKVKIETVDDNSVTISREIDILFSGSPKLSVSPDNIDLVGFESQVFAINLSDENGNPLASGTTMEVSVDNDDLVLSGTTFIELTDTQNKGNGYTDFEFQLRNPDRVTITDDVVLTISTSGPNGNSSKDVRFEVDKNEPGQPGSIFLHDISETDIGVRATGQREDTQLTFQVVDVNGNPLSNQNPTEVKFVFGNKPDGGEFISPESVVTNNLGQATVTLTSGTLPGTVQVMAETTDNSGRVIRSQPVVVVIHAGLPHQEHFTLLPLTINIVATASSMGNEYEFIALAGDRYSNTVPDGTAIYFSTTGGFIQGSSFTQNGRASSFLTVANPIPGNGIATVRASTADDNQNTVSETAQIIFSGEPIITVTPNTINLPNASDQTFNFTVRDSNGNPMAAGTNITVSVEGEDFELIGDTNITLRDVNASFSNIPALTEFKFNIKDSNPETVNNTPIIITIEVDGPNGYERKVIEGRKNKSP